MTGLARRLCLLLDACCPRAHAGEYAVWNARVARDEFASGALVAVNGTAHAIPALISMPVCSEDVQRV